jgi:hypothetical protein
MRPSDAEAVICSVAPRNRLSFGDVTAIEKSLAGGGDVDVPLQAPAVASRASTMYTRLTATPSNRQTGQ